MIFEKLSWWGNPIEFDNPADHSGLITRCDVADGEYELYYALLTWILCEGQDGSLEVNKPFLNLSRNVARNESHQLIVLGPGQWVSKNRRRTTINEI